MQIELTRTLSAVTASAFAIVANIAEWPEIIGSIRSIEVLTPGPIRPGSRLREERVIFGRKATQEVEVMTLERPHRLRLWVEHPDLNYELDYLIDAIHGGGCRLMLIFRGHPKTSAGRAVQPFIRPFAEISLRDELERDLSDLAAAVTRGAS